MTGRLATCAAGIALVAAACGGKQDAEDVGALAGKTEGKGSGSGDAPKRAPITAKSLSPVVIYTVRAVTSGTFIVPPVEAGAMYDPTLWARGKAGSAVIGGPWTGKTI